MKRFFSKISPSSVKEAKNRLKSVINSDRISVSQNKTLEKIKKEVAAVLVKYTKDDALPPEITVTQCRGTQYVLAATITAESIHNTAC